MKDAFVEGDIVLVERYKKRTYFGRLKRTYTGEGPLCEVMSLANLSKGVERPRFVPPWYLRPALWTFTGFVARP
jgi:hypothetical protein